MFMPAISKNSSRLERRNLIVSNYVVIGAFAVYENATRFTVNTNRMDDQLNLNASYELNPNRNLYYVYVLSTPDQEAAMRMATRLRTETRFKDAWVYHGLLGKPDQGEEPIVQGVDINPVTESNIETVQITDPTIKQNTSLSDSASAQNTTMSLETKTANVLPDADNEGKNFIFKLYRAVDNKEISGTVDAIDVDRARKIGTYQANMPLKVSSPKSKSGEVTVVSKVFGYRKVQHNVDYNKPVGGDISLAEDSAIVVPFELVRLQKGDIAAMYNVYFFNDAGIMRPESRFEINSLVEMMKENPKYKIKIHGHTNGAAIGKIISMGDKKDFFSLNGTKESVGSSKRLSEERANVVKNYLIANGISADRMQVKAWGGKRPIYDKNSAKAQENVRVEVEILDN
jgi:outer membrane protein OmpA-like peptidoglycan-associated protein